MQRDWVAVRHPKFLGERGPYVVVEGAVVAAVIPLAAQRLRKLNHLGGLQGCPALVGQPQRLVVDVLVGVAQALEDSTTSPLTPARCGARSGPPPRRPTAAAFR